MPPPKPEKKKEIILNRPPVSNSSLLFVPSNAFEGKSRPNVHEQILIKSDSNSHIRCG